MLRPAYDPLDLSSDFSNIHQQLKSAREELSRMAQQRIRQVESVIGLEQALFEVVNEQRTLREALQRLRAENQTMAEHERLDVESLRADLKRVEVQRPAASVENGFVGMTTISPVASQQPLAHHVHNGHNGPRRVLTSRPPQRPKAGASTRTGPSLDSTCLHDVIDRISHCESKADHLVVQLKTAQQDKELVRQAFETVMVRLQDALSRAKCEFDVARGTPGESPDHQFNQPE